MQTLNPIRKILTSLYFAYFAYICTAQFADADSEGLQALRLRPGPWHESPSQAEPQRPCRSRARDPGPGRRWEGNDELEDRA